MDRRRTQRDAAHHRAKSIKSRIKMQVYLNLAMTRTFLAITITFSGHHQLPSIIAIYNHNLPSPSILFTMDKFPASATKSEQRRWVDDKVMIINVTIKGAEKQWVAAETLVKELIEQLKGVDGYAADVADLYRKLAICYDRRESRIERDWANNMADIITRNLVSPSSGAWWASFVDTWGRSQ